MDTIVILPGNGYSLSAMRPFIIYLQTNNYKVIYIELKENKNKTLPYLSLTPIKYNSYIKERLPSLDKQYIFYGISMGCYHIQNFASNYPEYVKSIIMVEPTIAGGYYKPLYKFEYGRGNGDWLANLYKDNRQLDSLASNEKVIDIAISPNWDTSKPNKLFPPNIPFGILFTTHDNQNKIYTPIQLQSKKEYIRILKSKGLKPIVKTVNGPHTLDIIPKYFKTILKFIEQITY